MAVSASGILSLPLDHLKTLIANTDAFQAWVSAADAAAAAANIHLVNVPEGNLSRPFALIGFGDKWKYTRIANVQFETRGELFVMFEADVSSGAAASETDAVFEFMNQVGAVLADMWQLSGSGAYLHVVESELNKQPERMTSEDAQMAEDYYRVEFSIVWQGI